MSPASDLVVQLRALSARAGEHSSPAALGQVLAESLDTLAAFADQANAAFIAAGEILEGLGLEQLEQLQRPLTEKERQILEAAGLGHLVEATEQGGA